MFENHNLISIIRRRQESFVSPRPTFISSSCPVRWIYLEDQPFEEYFETSSDSELIDQVPGPEFIQELELQAANLSIDRYLQNSPQSDLTTKGTPNPSIITTASASSSPSPHISQPQTTPQQTIASSPTSKTQAPIVIPTPTVVSPLPAAMENIYVPLVLIANLGAMP